MTEALVKSEHYIAKPTTMNEAMELARIFSSSFMVPKAFQGKAADTFVAMQYGARLGIDPLAALQNIAVINGKPSIYGDALLAVIAGRPDCEDVFEEVTDDMAKCVVKRRGRSPVSRSFSMADAKKAKLWGKPGPWTDYPKRMLQMRARSWALRDAYPDALFGVSVAEEQSDLPVKEAKISIARDSLKGRIRDAVIDVSPVAHSDEDDVGQVIAEPDETSIVAEIRAALEGAETEERLSEVRSKYAAAFANLSAEAQTVVRVIGERARDRLCSPQKED